MVEETLKEEGVSGARIMGGGFGGCSINLIKDENVDEVIKNISTKYKTYYNIEMKVYRVKISDGINEYKRNKFVI
jgi:galactokinase